MGTHCFYFGSYFFVGIYYASVKHSSLARRAEAEVEPSWARARCLPSGLNAEKENCPPAPAPPSGSGRADRQGVDCRNPGSEQGDRAEFECGPYPGHRSRPLRSPELRGPCVSSSFPVIALPRGQLQGRPSGQKDARRKGRHGAAPPLCSAPQGGRHASRVRQTRALLVDFGVQQRSSLF